MNFVRSDAVEANNRSVGGGLLEHADEQYLVRGAKARALTMGRYHVTFVDIGALAQPVLRHRVLTNFHAESEGKTSTELINMLLERAPVPSSGM